MIAETPRLILSKFTLKDAPFFFELVNSPHWIKFIGDKNVKTLKDAEQKIISGHFKSYETHGFGFYKIQLKEENNKSIGTCGLIKRDTLDDVDIGFAFLPEYESKGFGYESATATIKLAKEAFKLQRIVAIINPENEKSIGLIEKLGLNYEKKVKPFADGEELLLFAKNL
ncbi:GNAT family N-acetyltransferase [uncultured Algibacter sp.]|uniref:GNAT family N-acetyltransferase n=1 Tax=uncultured Algibacter sp. TaxID=298659 RepID=UPI00260E75E1|nr:GNAT family N-acetyltransferase [uncultured Algibacter sp.]